MFNIRLSENGPRKEQIIFILRRTLPKLIINNDGWIKFDHLQDVTKQECSKLFESTIINLRSKNDDELYKLYLFEYNESIKEWDKEKEAEDSIKFFNMPDALADAKIFEVWSKKEYWYTDEATALLLGRNPDVVNYVKLEKLLKSDSPFVKKYLELKEIIERKFSRYIDLSSKTSFEKSTITSLMIKGKIHRITPYILMQYASTIEIPYPQKLFDLIHLYHGRILNVDVLSKEIDSLKLEIQGLKQQLSQKQSDDCNYVRITASDKYKRWQEERISLRQALPPNTSEDEIAKRILEKLKIDAPNFVMKSKGVYNSVGRIKREMNPKTKKAKN